MAASPTKRTLDFLRAAGFTVATVERWNPHSKTRQDLFGFLDLVGLRSGGFGLLGVQATSRSNAASRRNKILALPAARLWVECGNRIWLVTWKQEGPRGKAKKWAPKVENLTIGMFDEAGVLSEGRP